MASSLYLPAPTRRQANTLDGNGSGLSTSITPQSASAKKSPAAPAKRVPSYTSRCDSALAFSKLPPEQRRNPSSKSKLFVPRSTADFDDGGSFPEIHVAQYPRHMGNPHLSANNNSSNNSRAIVSRDVLSATVDSEGKVSYDAIVTGGTNTSKKVYAKHSDLRGCVPTSTEVALPSEEEALTTAERTQRAIDSLLSSKISSSKPTGDAITAAQNTASAHSRTQFIKYTPHESAPGYNPNASQRVIRMVPLQTDPMMPPKHMARKAPRGPAEDPVPILHAPPEKLTKEEREAWNIPSCISNWKNARGYTIPLDKRLAADGRGLRDDATVNSNFAVLSESLYVAERQAREEVRTRAAVQKRLVMRERDEREEELRELANKARLERGGVVPTATGGNGNGAEPESHRVYNEEEEESVQSVTEQNETTDRLQRDRLRAERRREREKEYRLERAGKSSELDATDEELAKKKRRLENDRDVSEKIALGTHVGTSGGDGVDSRLYSQNAGLDSGFGAEDEYNTYSRPMFDREGVTSSSIYRPTRGEGGMDAEEQYESLKGGTTGKFVPDKGFGGAEGGAVKGGASRNAPVQFEKAK
ncbi:hypothetical protein ACHAXN_012677 [Cyclotella atomus]